MYKLKAINTSNNYKVTWVFPKMSDAWQVALDLTLFAQGKPIRVYITRGVK